MRVNANTQNKRYYLSAFARERFLHALAVIFKVHVNEHCEEARKSCL
jgi:hypothetical protein